MADTLTAPATAGPVPEHPHAARGGLPHSTGRSANAPTSARGENLARLELQVVHGTLYRRIPTLRPAAPVEQPAFDHTGTTYGVACLSVSR